MPTIILNSTNKCLSNSTKRCHSKVITSLGRKKNLRPKCHDEHEEIGICLTIRNPYKSQLFSAPNLLFIFFFYFNFFKFNS